MTVISKQKRGRPRTVVREQTSNQKWHFEYWQEPYKQIAKDLSVRMFQMIDLYSKIKGIKAQMLKYEANRAEHCKSMGVLKRESDEVFNFEKELAMIPEIMEQMRKTAKEFRVSLPTIEDL